MDAISVFETFTYGGKRLRFFVWAGSFVCMGLFGWYYLIKGGRMGSFMGFVYIVSLCTVRRSKLGMFGGFGLLLCTLFIIILFANVLGTLPYVLSMRSHFVFRSVFAFCFWFGLVFSSLVYGGVLRCMAGLVFSGLPVFGGWVLCWVEIFRIFLR